MKRRMLMAVLLTSTSYLYAADQVTKATDAENTATVKAANPTGKKGRPKKVEALGVKSASDMNKQVPKKEARKKGSNLKEDAGATDENAVPKEKKEYLLTIPTCLDPRVIHEDLKVQESRLKTRRNCLNGFVNRYATELKQLNKKGLFAGEVTEYNKEVMEILVDIFQLEKGPKYTENIVSDFIEYPTSFRQDLRALWELIKENDHHEADTEINRLWKEMSDPCAMLVWCINYRGRHLNTHLKETGK